MENSHLTTSELIVLGYLHATPQAISQREIAKRTGLSVGLINMVIKKLVTTGHVQMSQLNRRSTKYFLTPLGFAEKELKSYRSILNILQSYRDLCVRFSAILDVLQGDGVQRLFLVGEGELAELAETVVLEKGMGTLERGLPPSGIKDAVVLNALPHPVHVKDIRVIDVVNTLGNGEKRKSLEV